MTVIVLLLGQQAMAVGTDAGITIDNTVNVDYEVDGINQDDLTSTVSFVVDRRVDFTLTQLGGALVEVTPGETLAFFDLLLTNVSNSTLDFRLALDAGIANVRAVPTTFSMDNIIYAANTLVYTGAEADPVTTGPQFVDELTEELNTVGGVENVFADDVPDASNGDGIETESDGFIVLTADLAVTKDFAVVGGDLGSGMPIPGATVEYTVTIVNSSGTDADFVVFDDTIDSDVVLVLDAYGGENDISVVNGVTTLACDIEINGEGDGCDSAGASFTVGAADLLLGITVLGNTTLTIKYQVTIP